MSINNHSIGIELLNAAFLSKNQQGEFYKTGYLRDYIIPDTDRAFENNLWWQIFPPAQLNAALEIVKLLFNTYPELKDVLGHSDINTTGNRAGDPGPVFPMQWFHAEVLGLDPNIPISRVYKTSGFSHLYKEPDVNAERIIEGGMPSNIDLGILDEIEGWVFVHVLNYPDNNSVFTGWIQRNRIKQDKDKPRHYHRATETSLPDDYQPKINDWSKFAPI